MEQLNQRCRVNLYPPGAALQNPKPPKQKAKFGPIASKLSWHSAPSVPNAQLLFKYYHVFLSNRCDRGETRRMEGVMEKSYSLILKWDDGIKHLTQSFTLKHPTDIILLHPHLSLQLRLRWQGWWWGVGWGFLPKAPWCHSLRPTQYQDPPSSL